MRAQKKPEEAHKNVGIWIRVSTEDQARGESPEHHERRAKMYAESRGWSVLTTYDLSGVSGKSVMHHPEAERMLRDVNAGVITGLIFSKLARLARNTRELLDFSDLFRDAGADLISLQESIDTSTPAGRLFYTMIAAMATWEREEIAERVAASVVVRAEMGKPLGGAAPFGYRWENRRLVLDEKEAPVVNLLFQLFEEHGRKKTVARILTERGYRTRSGANFGDTTVTRLLTDPTFKGRHRLNYTKSLGDGRNWKLKPEAEWSYVAVEPIIPEELWDRVNATLSERKDNWKRPSKKVRTLFAGLVFCHCSSKMYVPGNTPKYVCMACRNKIPVVDLESVFHEQLRQFFVSAEEIASHLEAADEVIAGKNDLLATLRGEQTKLTTEAEKLYRLYLEDRLSPESFQKRNRPLEERLRQLEDEIPRLEGEIDFLRIQFLASGNIAEEAHHLHARWPDLLFEERRRIVETITDKITIGDGDISFELRYLPSPAEILSKEHRMSAPADISTMDGGSASARRSRSRGTWPGSPGRCSTGSTCRWRWRR
jgi:site-specific DNA recombinase